MISLQVRIASAAVALVVSAVTLALIEDSAAVALAFSAVTLALKEPSAVVALVASAVTLALIADSAASALVFSASIELVKVVTADVRFASSWASRLLTRFSNVWKLVI